MGGLEQTKDFYRLFMVPGMAHCQGGDGPNYFGQGAHIGPALPSSSADDDILKALERWVEQGVAPDKLIATKFKDALPGTV
jgi:feruloyl esterase